MGSSACRRIGKACARGQDIAGLQLFLRNAQHEQGRRAARANESQRRHHASEERTRNLAPHRVAGAAFGAVERPFELRAIKHCICLRRRLSNRGFLARSKRTCCRWRSALVLQTPQELAMKRSFDAFDGGSDGSGACKRVALQPQRGCVIQPKVAAHRLPWVKASKPAQPCRGCGQKRRNPFRVGFSHGSFSQGSRFAPTLGYLTMPRWGMDDGACSDAERPGPGHSKLDVGC
jgi:hypothetical protein